MPLEITEQPSDIMVAPGGDAVISVVAQGDELTYRWQVKLPTKDAFQNTTTTGYNTDTLNFKVAQSYDGRQYRCVITDKYGNTVTSEAATLTIQNYIIDGDFTYDRLDNGGLILVSYSGTATQLTIPTTVEGYTVTEIGEEAFMGKSIVSISLPNSITIIHARAFKNCSNLSSMDTHD